MEMSGVLFLITWITMLVKGFIRAISFVELQSLGNAAG